MYEGNTFESAGVTTLSFMPVDTAVVAGGNVHGGGSGGVHGFNMGFIFTKNSVRKPQKMFLPNLHV